MIRYRIEGWQNSVKKRKNMSDTKEFDVEQIKGSQFMDRQDRQYFEKHGAPLKPINMSENNSREGSI